MSDSTTNETTYDITDLPSKDHPTRAKVKKGVTIGILAAGALLLTDDLVKRFSREKKVTVTVADKVDETESTD